MSRLMLTRPEPGRMRRSTYGSATPLQAFVRQCPEKCSGGQQCRPRLQRQMTWLSDSAHIVLAVAVPEREAATRGAVATEGTAMAAVASAEAVIVAVASGKAGARETRRAATEFQETPTMGLVRVTRVMHTAGRAQEALGTMVAEWGPLMAAGLAWIGLVEPSGAWMGMGRAQQPGSAGPTSVQEWVPCAALMQALCWAPGCGAALRVPYHAGEQSHARPDTHITGLQLHQP